MNTPWEILGAIAVVGLVSLLAGLYAGERGDGFEGEKRVATGLGLLAGACLLAIYKSLSGLAGIQSWWGS